jgi:2,4-dienoyl-CoA reductase-like NADH-dependent reductase (Old Yellow Enzyme family)
VPKRYFNYQTLDELRRDAARLGFDLPIIESSAEVRRILARPVEIAGEGCAWRVGNSLAVHPMEGCDGELDGAPGELTFRRYRRFGAGGAKLIWFEACAVVPEGRANPRQLWIHAGTVACLKALLAECRQAHERAFGSSDSLLTVLQLTHSGRYSFASPRAAARHPVLDRFPSLSDQAPRAEVPELASDEYLEELEDKFVLAAELAREAGFDGIDLKMTHGYLLSELVGARHRPGCYGGPLENRARFALSVFGKIRKRLGAHFLLACRLGVYDGVPYGVTPGDSSGVPREFPMPYEWGFGVKAENPMEMDLAEPLRLVGWLEEAGVRILNISIGNPYVNPHLGRPFEKPNEGAYETPEHPLVGVARHFTAAARIQRSFPKLAVVGTGYSWLQHFMFHAAAANLQLGTVRLVGVGRGALAYPSLFREALEGGSLDPLHTCKTLSYCTYLMRSKHHPMGQFPTGCPPFDKEGYGEIVKQARHAARASAEKVVRHEKGGE